VSLWKQQLTRFRELNRLTDVQQSLLARAEATLTPDAYLLPPTRDTLGPQIRAAFERRHWAVFADLGSVFGARDTHEPEQLTLTSLISAEVLMAETCSCSITSDYCSIGYECRNPTNCAYVSGCGTFWQYNCVGTCQDA